MCFVVCGSAESKEDYIAIYIVNHTLAEMRQRKRKRNEEIIYAAKTLTQLCYSGYETRHELSLPNSGHPYFGDA